ncbi:MAG: tetratricopeptide repeat protein [Candidatus Kapabacteria bacterium]|nr:tetratricopeptide repeat protein [Candidatus Kapabacteria bacterium]
MTNLTEQDINSFLLKAKEYNLQGKHLETENLLKPIIEDDSSQKFPRLRAQALIMFASVVSLNGKSSEALPFAEEAEQICMSLEREEAGNLLPKAWNVIGNCHRLLAHFEKALALFSDVIIECRENGYKEELEFNLGESAIVYMEIGDYAKALDFYQQAMDVAIEIGHKRGISRWVNGIGIVHQNLGEHEKALEYFQKSLAMDEESSIPTHRATMLGNIGAVYHGLENHAKALEYSLEALALDEEVNNRFGIARHNGNIGQIYIHLGEYKTAMEHLQRALALDTELENKWNLCVWTGLIGSIYASNDSELYNPALAEDYFFRTLAMSVPAGNKTMLLETHRALSDLYKEQERWKECAEEFVKFYNVEKEIRSEEALNQTRILENRRRVEEADRDRQLKLARLQEHERILTRMLPPTIAQRMVGGEEPIADYFENVSILFSDIKGFTTITADMPAFIIVQFLGSVFGEFDRIVRKYGCEKIKTIGDGYMAIAGAPEQCADHAERIVSAAFEMMESIKIPEGLEEYFPDKSKLGVRIGLHSGAVVAGVVGSERFMYDVYSDAVNTASRMESHGEVDRIHVSEDFAHHLQSRYETSNNTTHEIHFIPRGEIEIKGKGTMKTYFLERPNGNG